MIERFHLRNGLDAFVSPNRCAPVVAVSLWYRVGSADELPGQTGLAHLFEHLMSRLAQRGQGLERMQERADRIGMYASLLGTPDRVDEEVGRYEAVTRDDVRDFVATHLRPDCSVRLTYLPESG